MGRRLVRAGAYLALPLWSVIGIALPAMATITAALSLDELVLRSDCIVVATVVSQTTLRDDMNRIVTDATLEVEDCLKGELRPGATIVVRRLGGELGDIGMHIEGEPSFTEGDRNIVFAQRLAHGGPLRPVGMSQGVMPVATDLHGREMVLPGGAGLALVRQVHGGRLISAPGALLGPRPAPVVLDEIRQTVDRTRGQ